MICEAIFYSAQLIVLLVFVGHFPLSRGYYNLKKNNKMG